MKIVITSKLSPGASRRLRKAARKHWRAEFPPFLGFAHGWRPYEYFPMHDEDDPIDHAYSHAVARQMMIEAGETFKYELA